MSNVPVYPEAVSVPSNRGNREENADEDGAVTVESNEGTERDAAAEGNAVEDSNEDANGRLGEEQRTSQLASGTFVEAPSVMEAKQAWEDLKRIIKPPRNAGPGYKDPNLDLLTRFRLESMQQFLWTYINPQSAYHSRWGAASLHTATSLEKKEAYARRLREWSRAFIEDREHLPINKYGAWNESILDKDTELAQEIHLHLQSIGKYVRAQDIVDFLHTPAMQEQSGIKNRISVATAQRWMKKLNYRWTSGPKGQFVDGHERDDVVSYRQNVFLPAWNNLKAKTRDWSPGSKPASDPILHARYTVVWFHDESTFYANDRRRVRWVHNDETATPYAKGEGPSQMVVDFVSADHGWLRSPDGEKSAQVLFKAGKNRDGYFTSDDILAHAAEAMNILDEYYPHEDHAFMYDNAKTHLKRADDALSARNMPKGISKLGSNWGVRTNLLDVNGNLVYDTHGKLVKTKVRMEDAVFANGEKQSLYFPEGHEHVGLFKGMAVILQERGLNAESKLRYECAGFKCPKQTEPCCCRRVLYDQPDFIAIDSLLEKACKARGYTVIFLPKFHCELNFIEQCWGSAKRTYREYPASSKEADLERNVRSSLASVPLESMRRYVQI
jgi:hypothetical protein